MPLNSLDLPRPPGETRVVVAMSGGVDSSVVAALLRSQGYDVIGVTLQLYDHGAATHRAGACCAGRDIHDARDVAERIGIPHYVLDYEERFRREVIDTFARDYAEGRTPIPCVECNRSIKFRDLLDTARDLGADVLATGHYIESRALPDGRRALYRAMDADRDQSYFLYATTPEQLAMLRFPLGHLPKSDSQDICFVPQGRYGDLIARLKPEAAEAGEIVHVDGRVLGSHSGIVHYTVGQRRGLGVSVGEPLFVVRIDAPGRRVIVGPREALATRVIRLADVNWLGDVPVDAIAPEGIEVAVRVRSTRAPRPATLFHRDGGFEVELAAAEEGVAPGQACVFYESVESRSRVLGGGTIVSTVSAAHPAVAA